MISRIIEHELKKYLFKGKAIVLFEPRQVGKTTRIKKMVGEMDKPVLYLDGDDNAIRQMIKIA